MRAVSSIGVGGALPAAPRSLAWFLRGVVSTSSVGPILRVRGYEYPLPQGARYPPGAELRLKLFFEGDGLKLQILGPAGSPREPARSTDLSALLAQLNLPVVARQAGRLLPAHLPPTAEAIATLIHRLSAAEGGGQALGHVVRVLTTAAAANVSSARGPYAAAVLGWLAGPSRRPDRWRQRLGGSTPPTPESVLAATFDGLIIDDVANQLDRTPELALSRLAQDDALAEIAAGLDLADAWKNALAELQARLDGDRLMALHGLAAPYRFIELPVRAESGWRRAQLHLLSDGGTGTAVVDVCTDRLGEVWMLLQLNQRGGQLRVQADRTTTRQALEGELESMQGGLTELGYPSVSISIEPWDGDRLGAAVALFDRRPLEVSL